MDRELVKEVTVLDEAQAIGRMLLLLEARLNSQFNRMAYREGTLSAETAEQKALPNVLDEILAQLQESRQDLQHILEFIDSQILPKIS